MWLKTKNILATTKADDVQEQLDSIVQEFDPRTAFAHVAKLKEQGKVEMKIEEATESIIVTVTYLVESPHPGRREVLSIDPITKLVASIERYQLSDGDYRYEGRIELQEYNQPIEAGLFDLANEVPSQTAHLDFADKDLGLAQGQLSDDDVATQVVRQFFESLITRDYNSAGRLFPGIGPDLQQEFGRIKLIRIVSIGAAIRRTDSETRDFVVACTIEIEEKGEKSTVKMDGVHVTPLGGQPGRWIITSFGN